MTPLKHFLCLSEIDATPLRVMLDRAREMKHARHVARRDAAHALRQAQPLAGRTLAMIFEKPSTRTRVSFEVGMYELGGHALYLNSNDMQLGRGETVADTARVLSRYADAITLRCHAHETLTELAGAATVPVINALSNLTHPCQVMADILTFEEHRGPIAGTAIAWVGDGNNMAHAWMMAAAKFGFALRIACPAEFAPKAEALARARALGADITLTHDPREAVAGVHAVNADTWVSMGDTDAEARMKRLAPYQVNGALMALAAPDALFLHCLPAHRGEEVTVEVIDGPQSVVWDEAENRLHVQKAILLWCLNML